MKEVHTCASCGAANPPGFRFCGQCGAALTALAPVEERRVVTLLFCDVVGFTALSEPADPEDVDALLGTYHAAVRRVVESHGGVVEKFIGDAVVGVFGAPEVHEDDPERAVRAALRVVGTVAGIARPDGLPLEVRVGVNTGEALVRVGVDPRSGRGMLAGDAVNTAARLQAAAPPMTVFIGELTHALTEGRFVLEGPVDVTVRGKARALRAWRPLSPVSLAGARVRPGPLSPLVGREGEVAYLTALFESAVSSGTPRFALVLGEPGIGKSRLVHELFAHVDARPGLTVWRQGHCPPYGEGVTYWPLAEIVRAQCGVQETADDLLVRDRLDEAVPQGPDHGWLVERLGALLGLEAPSAPVEESHAAWLRFLESLAASYPAVVVVEDAHWADDPLLDFLEHLALHAADVPLVVLATARPEVLRGRHPFGEDGARADRLVLRPLSPRETERLVDVVGGDSGAVASARGDIVQRSGGNPLFVEQCVRLVAESADASSVPATVGAVIAARLGALSAEERELVADAAVVGDTFWAGALEALRPRSAGEARRLLDLLVSQQLVHRSRASFLSGEREYAFSHALTRDVAYAQVPRASRARGHAAVAHWLEGRPGAEGELADLLAHHYSAALELARTLGDGVFAEALRGPARRAYVAAADRVMDLDVVSAERYCRAALELGEAGDAGSGQLEARLGEALLWSGRSQEAAEHLEQAVALLRAAGDSRRAALAMVRLARARNNLEADRDEVRALHEGAAALLEGDGPSSELVTVLTEWSRDAGNAGRTDEGLALAERAIAVSDARGLERPALALSLRATYRADAGDPGCLDDFREALRLARRQGLGMERARVWNNYAISLTFIEGPRRAVEEFESAVTFGASRGFVEPVFFGRAASVDALVYGGYWDQAIDVADALRRDVPELARADTGWTQLAVIAPLVWRGRLDEARYRLSRVHEELPPLRYEEDKVLAVVARALLEARVDLRGAVDLVRAAVIEPPPFRPGDPWGMAWMYELAPEVTRIVLSAGDSGSAHALRARARGELRGRELAMVAMDALLAEDGGVLDEAAAGFADAARRWHDFGVPYEEGHALLGQGRCLVALGRAPEAAAPLASAREVFARLGAKPALAETDGLLVGLGLAAPAAGRDVSDG